MVAEQPLIARDEGASRTRPEDRSRSVDGLRAVAALLVVIAHAGFLPQREYGLGTHAISIVQSATGAGVLLFFTLSGYLIGGPYLRALVEGTELPDWRTYAVRRTGRIYPAYWIALVGVLLAGMTKLSSVELWQVPVHLSLLQSSWPRPGEATAVFFVAWTLGIEMAFYVFCPVAARLLRRVHPGPWSAGTLARLIGALAAATTVWTIVAHWRAPGGLKGGLALNGLQDWFYAFAPGLLVALAALAPEGAAARAWHAFVLRRRVVLPLVAVLWVLACRIDRSQAPILNAAGDPVYVLASGLVLGTVLSGPPSWLRALAPIGLVSYGVYLWHSIVIDVLLTHLVRGGLVAYAVDFCVALAVTLPLATASWLLVERPIIRRTARWAAARREQAAAPAVAAPPPVLAR